MREICKGCCCAIPEIQYDFECIFTKNNRAEECPCTQCLVQIMCINACDQRIATGDKLIKEASHARYVQRVLSD